LSRCRSRSLSLNFPFSYLSIIPLYLSLSSLPVSLTPLQLVLAELFGSGFDREYRSFVTGVSTGRRSGWRIVGRLREGERAQSRPSPTPSPRPCGRLDQQAMVMAKWSSPGAICNSDSRHRKKRIVPLGASLFHLTSPEVPSSDSRQCPKKELLLTFKNGCSMTSI